jgi:hypothetical protein
MRILKSRWFARFARKERITDAKLCEVLAEAERGLIDADYGDGVIKQRIARPNEGKSGGYRSIILYRRGDRSIFVFGIAKSDQDNIDESDERDFKQLAAVLLAVTDAELDELVEGGAYIEVKCDVPSEEL